MSLPPKIGRYLVRQRLGGGAMGEVWLAYDADLEREVAIKTLRPEYAHDVEHLTRFLREARASARVRDNHVVAIYEVGTERQSAYLVMEYVTGDSLDKAVTPEQPMPWPDATRAIRDAAQG